MRARTHLLLRQDDPAEELVLEAFHGDGEVDDGGPGADLRRVRGVRQLRGDVHLEAVHDVDLLIADLYLRADQQRKNQKANFSLQREAK